MNWKPSRIFFGWWIVVAAFLVALYVGGAVFYGFTTIFEPIADELNWSYTHVSFAASLRGMEMGLLAPLVGFLVDRWGPRRLIFSGAIITAIGLFLLSRTTSLAMFYGAFVVLAIGMSTCTMTVLLTTIANWFRKNVGIASGITVSGFGCGGLLVPVIVRLIDIYDWRIAMAVLALGSLVVVLPLSFLFRHKPEQYGYLPDGQAEASGISGSEMGLTQFDDVDFEVKQAIKSGAFWRMALAFAYHVMVVTAIVTHVMPYLSSIGIVRSISSLVATAIPLTSIIGRIGFGWLGDKLDRRLVAMAAFIMVGAGVLIFGYVSSTSMWLLVPFFLLFGIGYGGSNALRPSMVRDYFGRSNFGTVFGFLIGINMLGGIIGSPLAGWVYDNWGSYDGIWFFFAGLSIVAIILIITIHPARVTAELSGRNLS